jgi:hypothetical protein
MVTASKLYVNAMEIKRKHSEPGTIAPSDRENFQRGRSDSTLFLDWAVDVLRYLDFLGDEQRTAMKMVYWDRENMQALTDKVAKFVVFVADEGLEKWYKSLPIKLIRQGEKIDGRF